MSSKALTPSSRGLGHHPFTVSTGVRIPVGSPSDATIAAALADFVPAHESFEGEFALIHDTLTQGAPTPVTLHDARQSLELITAIYYSAETGAPVSLPIGKDHPRYASWAPASGSFNKVLQRG